MTNASLRGTAKAFPASSENESLVDSRTIKASSLSSAPTYGERITINPISDQIVGVAFVVSGTYIPVD